MKKYNIIALLILLSVLTACGHKKILVFASSGIQVDESQKNIIVTEGTTHHEKELEFSGSSPVTINVQSPTGKFTLDATEDGLYIINLQKDTIVGSYQHIGEDNGTVKISTDQLKHTIDSLVQLTAGLNVSTAGKNYFIPPGKIGRVTANTKARVFGPYTTVPSGFDASTVPELYKFYTNPELREIIDKLSGHIPVVNK
jgi:hypothetical protein